MRQRREGRIINITWMGGIITMPGLSHYHGSKFALEGISASFGEEVKPLGIFFTAVEPGMFRTDFAGRSMVRSARSIPYYDAVSDPIREARKARSGRQPGDPAKAGKALVELLADSTPPAHLLLGTDASDDVQKELDTIRAEFAQWKAADSINGFRSGPIDSGEVIRGDQSVRWSPLAPAVYGKTGGRN